MADRAFVQPPSMTGLGPGLSFGKELMKKNPDFISILLIPTAIGGSSIGQWLRNGQHRNIALFTNFEDKVALGQNYGTIKGVLWHQGESDARQKFTIHEYDKNLVLLVSKFRMAANDKQLPVIIGELGNYSKNQDNRNRLNLKRLTYSKTDSLVKLVSSSGLTGKGNRLHFNSKSMRLLGQRYAEKVLELG